MSPTKIITEDSATARKIRDLLENQAIIEKAEIWENEHPIYLFDAHAGYGKRIRSLKEELDRRQSERFEAAPAPVVVPVAGADDRDPGCVAYWPECVPGDYDPRCCRFPKSCSCAHAIPLPQAGEVPPA